MDELSGPATAAEDRATVRRILAGDDAVFRQLFDAYFPRLYRFAVARLGGDREEARDAVQQTFCRAIEHLDGWRGEAALYTWFCQICQNVIRDHHRARGTESVRVVRLEDNPDVRAVLETLAGPALGEPEMQAWRAEVGQVVQATLDRLPGRYADVLEWKYVLGLSVAEIAERLAVGPKAAESQLTRAREAFRDAVGTLFAAEDLLLPPRHPGGHEP